MNDDDPGNDADMDEVLAEGLDNMDGARKKISGKKIVLFAAPVLLILIGGIAALLGGAFSSPEPEMAEGETKSAKNAVFFDLPDLLVNLNTNSRKPTFLKISVSLEMESAEDTARVVQVMPRVIDNFQVYLRELRTEDLQGSAGIYRLREELLVRVNGAIEPAKVRDVLFREMLVQ